MTVCIDAFVLISAVLSREASHEESIRIIDASRLESTATVCGKPSAPSPEADEAEFPSTKPRTAEIKISGTDSRIAPQAP